MKCTGRSKKTSLAQAWGLLLGGPKKAIAAFKTPGTSGGSHPAGLPFLRGKQLGISPGSARTPGRLEDVAQEVLRQVLKGLSWS